VIYATIGTSEPFDRLIDAVQRLPGDEERVLQVGESTLRPPAATCVEYLAYDELRAHMARARVVVTHAGVGTILTAIDLGKRPIVVPRLRRHGEAVDDHQVAIARRLDASGLVTCVEVLSRLPAVVAHPPALRATRGSSKLASELGAYLADVVGRAASAPTRHV
jgi:UDP-N-acetylglucosamine transferase subunit ALG13